MCQNYGSDRFYSLFCLVLLCLFAFVAPLTHGQTDLQTSESPSLGELQKSDEYTLSELSDDLVERLTKRIEQLESLKAKSEALRAEVQRLLLTSESLQTTLGAISLSRDDFKLKYEKEQLAVSEAKRVMESEVQRLRTERDNAVSMGLLVSAIGLPVGAFAGGTICSGDFGYGAIASVSCVIIEASLYGLYKLYEYGNTIKQ